MKRYKRRRTRDPATTLAINSNEIEEDKEQNQQQEETQKSSTVASMLDLPSVIAVDILSRLPIKTIFHCRCVCKTWLNLLSNPDFAKLYLERPPSISILLSITRKFYMLELGEDYVYTRRPNTPKRFNTKFNLPPSNELEFVGSCNGLLCLSDRSLADSLYLSNPILGEYAALPKPRRQKLEFGPFGVVYDFGFCPATGHYKVLRIMRQSVRGKTRPDSFDTKSQGKVHTLGTGTWRYVGDVPFPLKGKLGGVTVNGALHWMTGLEGTIVIYSFDIAEEQVQPIPPPPSEFKTTNYWLSLGVIGDSLCMFDNSGSAHLEIWSMKEYGVAESWSKDFILKTSIPSGLHKCLLQPFTLWKEGEILISCEFGALVSYNPKGRNFTELKVYGVKSPVVPSFDVQAVSYVPSFLSLRDVMMGERLRIVNVRSK